MIGPKSALCVVMSSLLGIAIVSNLAEAQNIPGAPDFNSVSNQTEMPIPGAGHDYQSLLNETVNPSNGSVSFKISFPVPKSRGITLPYAWTYNSASVNPLNMVTGNQPTWDAYWSQSGPTVDGWNTSSGIPWAGVSVWSYAPPNNGAQTFAKCNVQSGMTFTGPDGVMHNLYISAQATAQTGSGWIQICGTQRFVPPGGDGQVIGIPDPNTAVNDLAGISPSSGSFIVVDKNGTIYSFAGGKSAQMAASPAYWSGMEDKNGNMIAPGVNGVLYTDTSGRPGPTINSTQAITYSTPSSSQTFHFPGSLTVGNLTYTATWTTTSVNYSVQETPTTTTDSGVLCNAIPETVSGTRMVLSAISVPGNGKTITYTFHYDDPYGLLSEIDYPDGGWIKYGWTLSPSGENEYASWSGTEYAGTSGDDGSVYTPVNYGCGGMYQTPVLTSRTVSFDGVSTAQSQTFSYSTTWDAPNDGSIDGWSQKTTQVVTTDNVTGESSTIKYTYIPYLVPNQPDASGVAGPAIPLESEIDYSDWGKSTWSKTVNKTWADQFTMTSEVTTVVPTGEQAGTIYSYGTENNGLATAADSLQYLSERDDYDYSTSPVASRKPTKKTIYSYYCCAMYPSSFNSTFTTSQVPLTILPEMTNATEEDANNNPLAAISYGYDGAALANISAIEHDANFSTGMTSRGNLTSITRCTSPATNCAAGPTVTYTYDITGQPSSMTDACGNGSCSDVSGSSHTTTFSFADTGNTNAYLTGITNPLGQSRTFQYNYAIGYLTEAIDENGYATYYYYNDPLDRLTEVDYPDNGKVTHSYSDSGNSVTNYQLISGSLSGSSCSGSCKVTESVRDGMFHMIHSYVLSDPGGIDNVDTTYDGEGRVRTVSNSYRATSTGVTTTSYDALGRKVQVQEQDGSALQWCYDGQPSALPGGSAISYCSSSQLAQHTATPVGTWVDSTDENGNHWERGSDFFGNLLDVMEPNGSSQVPSMETDYSYDLMNNLINVDQRGMSGNTPRIRSFSYDNLSRLVSSSNSETGTIGYTYDLDGNVVTKTDARGISIYYTYDTINRLLGKTYSDGTLSSCYQYDNAPKGVSFLAAEWTQAGSCAPSAPSAGYQSLRKMGSYDAMGRLLGEQQCVLGFCTSVAPPSAPGANCQSLTDANGLSYCYDLAGDLAAYSNGLTSTAFPQQYMLFSQGFDGVMRPTSLVNNTWNGPTFPSNLLTVGTTDGYTPFNALQNWTLGSGNLSVSKSYDNRMRVTGQTAIQQ